MKYFLLFVMLVHGLIHLLGFTKAFQLARVEQLHLSISKPVGLLWLLSTILFVLSFILILLNKDFWWLPAIVAVALSQVLIFSVWPDAKFGSIANLIILIALIIGFSSWQFNNETNKQMALLLKDGDVTEKTIITEEMLSPLPTPIKNWLHSTGIVGKDLFHHAQFKQNGLMRLKPDQENWAKAEAQQIVNLTEPGFLWTINMKMMPLLNVVGKDFYLHGDAQMLIKLASVVPVVNVDDNPKTNESTLQRFLLELPWYPSAALSPYITWEEIDSQSAKATMTYQGVSGAATFFFKESGELEKVSAMRFKDNAVDAERLECIGEVKATSVIKGIKIPTELEVSWVLEDGLFTWYKVKVIEAQFE